MNSGFYRIWVLALTLIAVASSISCDRANPPMFQKLSPSQTGITFENRLVEEPLMNSVNYLYFYDGGGVAVGDINNDGLTDIYLGANSGENQLYLNKGDLQFENITEHAGVSGGTGNWITGTAMADVNGDGWLDIYICSANYLGKTGPNQLFINNGDLTFSERAPEYGLDFKGLSRHAAFFDFDLDGDLDLYLLNHSVHSKATYGHRDEKSKVRDAEAGDRLYRNNGKSFTDVSDASGIHQSILGYGLGVAIGDVNQDGFPDIYISNDFHEDDYLYYHNGSRTNPAFIDAMRESMPHTSSASMGNDMADFNNDGLLDIVVLDMMPDTEKIRKSAVTSDAYDIYQAKLDFGYYHQLRRNTLQLNRGPAPGSSENTHLFSDIGAQAGIHASDWSWSTFLADLDNDGYKDLFISNGIYRRPNDLDYLRYIKKIAPQLETEGRAGDKMPTPIAQEMLDQIVPQMPSVPIANHAYAGSSVLPMMNRAEEWGLADPNFSSGAAYADFDNDGDLDLVVNNVNDAAAVYRNDLISSAADSSINWLRIKLQSDDANRFGIGAKVTLYQDASLQYQEMQSSRGFQSSVEPVLHFGLGEDQEIDSLVVIWPGGEKQVLASANANQVLTLTRENSMQGESNKLAEISTLFSKSNNATGFTHKENIFLEFNREPFIPHFISTEGPALAVADVNGDGFDDVFIGGAKQQAGRLFIASKQGGYRSVNDALFQADARAEDVDAAFFDANGDGLPDLYVVSGGNEFFGKAKPLLDRLYLNRGNGQFVKDADALPELYNNGSCVAPADFDGDGDVDLFVGSRSVPRHYGRVPKSYLLQNDGEGNFADVTADRAAMLSNLGMITDADWGDVNGDGQPDLVVVGEWMPVTILQNEDGKLRDITANSGLQSQTGWWQSVALADVNGDGRSDIFAGNLGLNSILRASQKEPVRLYIGEFGANKRTHTLLAYPAEGDWYPLAPIETMMFNIPSLQQKYATHTDYAGQSIDQILSPEQIGRAQILAATQFASQLILSAANGKWQPANLPAELQASPIFSFLLADINDDDELDCIAGGNFSGVHPELGRYDASYGSVMLGDGNGGFSVLSMQESGLALTGEVRGLALVHGPQGKKLMVARNNSTLESLSLTQ